MSLQEIEVGHLKTGQGYLEWRVLRVVGEGEMIPVQRLIDGIKLLAEVHSELAILSPGRTRICRWRCRHCQRMRR